MVPRRTFRPCCGLKLVVENQPWASKAASRLSKAGRNIQRTRPARAAAPTRAVATQPIVKPAEPNQRLS